MASWRDIDEVDLYHADRYTFSQLFTLWSRIVNQNTPHGVPDVFWLYVLNRTVDPYLILKLTNFPNRSTMFSISIQLVNYLILFNAIFIIFLLFMRVNVDQ